MLSRLPPLICVYSITWKSFTFNNNKIFSFIVNDPQYEQSVKSNLSSEINTNPENDTLKVLNDFKIAFEETLENTSSISKEEYISLYFDYLFSQIVNKK